MNELHRFLRHALGPFAVLAVEQGWIPEAAQKDVVEAVVIALGFAIPFGWSWLLDKTGRRP